MHVPDVEYPHGLAVRPDVLCVAVTARVEDVAPTQAVALLRAAAAALQARIRLVAGGVSGRGRPR